MCDITIGGGILAAIVNLIVAAVVLLISGRIVPGLRVKSFGGALVGAIALARVGMAGRPGFGWPDPRLAVHAYDLAEAPLCASARLGLRLIT